jgi:aspartyl-tRNA(Asn)/glutamyl-tRNA(Gln) amidotransferase subunit B
VNGWETLIGLEVHVELSTRTKIFCGCRNEAGAPPNTHVCPVCLGLPGVLPVMNAAALESALLVGLALGCEIAPRFKFDRKHYYYPDLPKNFQISQYDRPFATGGALALDGGGRIVRITRVHLEEDAGKLVHEGAGDRIAGATAALVDYNRAGVPLLEIVTEPDLRAPADAAACLRRLQTLVRYLGVSDANMEEGRLRCDANISVRRAGEGALGAKVEIKNMNSFRSVERALAYEAERQRALLEAGGRPVRETRSWNEATGETTPMRGKEGAQDYRYFPEPDLVAFTADAARLDALRARLPEMPETKRARYVREYGLSEYDAGVLTADRAVAEYFEAAVAAGAAPKAAGNWIANELLGALHARNERIADTKVSPAALAKLLSLIGNGTISGKIAKTVFAEMVETGAGPAEIVNARGLVQIADEGELARIVRDVLAENPGPVADFKAGKPQAIGFLVGQVMKATQGKANPKAANKLIREALS